MRLLVIDEPWAHTPWLIQACIDEGAHVEVAVRREGIARTRMLGVRTHLLPDEPAGEAAALATLLAASSWDHVLPVSERLLLLCAGMSSTAATALPVARELLPLLADRRRMLQFVDGLHITIPAQRSLPDADSIAAAAQQLRWPLVLRGRQGSSASQVRIVDDNLAALAAWRYLRAASIGAPFAQACVPGEIVIVAGMFSAGAPVRAVCCELIERWPLPTSPSTLQRTFRDAGLEQQSLKLLHALRYNGLVSIEWMRRPDGGYTFIELNPRSWGGIACTRSVNIDFARLHAVTLMGRTPVIPAAPFAIPVGEILPLFPQYLAARVGHGGFFDALRHPRLWWRGLRPAPWRQPRLLLALSRQLLVAYRRRRRKTTP